ncbi:MAG: hypothetical protein ABFQ65_03380 [Nanoarchaeota archaeon]
MKSKKTLSKIYKLIDKNTTWKKVGFFLILNIIIQIILTSRIAEKFKTFSNGLDALDIKIGYGVEYAKELLTTTSNEGLQYYLYNFFTLDMFFIVVYSISYALLLSLLFKKAFSPKNKIQKLVILPILGGIIDILENFSIVLMIFILPVFSTKLALLSSILSLFKWGIIYIGMALTLLGIIGWIVKSIKK